MFLMFSSTYSFVVALSRVCNYFISVSAYSLSFIITRITFFGSSLSRPQHKFGECIFIFVLYSVSNFHDIIRMGRSRLDALSLTTVPLSLATNYMTLKKKNATNKMSIKHR